MKEKKTVEALNRNSMGNIPSIHVLRGVVASFSDLFQSYETPYLGVIVCASGMYLLATVRTNAVFKVLSHQNIISHTT